MKLRAIEWYEEQVVMWATVRNYKWRIQQEVDGQWQTIPLVELGAQPVGFDPDEVNLEDYI